MEVVYSSLVLNNTKTRILKHLRFLRPTRGFTLGEVELELLVEESLRSRWPENDKRAEINSTVHYIQGNSNNYSISLETRDENLLQARASPSVFLNHFFPFSVYHSTIGVLK